MTMALGMRELNDLAPWELTERLGSGERIAVAGSPHDPSSATNQWLALITMLTQRAVAHARTDDGSEVRDYAVAVDVLLDRAEASGAVSHDECLVRRLNLTSLLLRLRPTDRTPGVRLLDPEDAARTFLEEAGMPLSEARASARDWRSRTLPEIRALRRLKNLLGPVADLRPRLEPGPLGEEVGAWLALRPELP
ncbi:hypothetical protein ACGFMM_24525 [Streptomyces sp. NPDC048604]|uniref:hypothetical protein n=1 Tax=Streptomyces sp. NPDC048604 TaxID=3365578 RepID=UPI003713DB49